MIRQNSGELLWIALKQGKDMDGIINIYKEKGYTSFDVVAKLRGILKIRKIGHTGTLDPMAEGVLPVCIGSATKVCGLLTDKDKEYAVVFRLGITTDTQDITGNVLSEKEVAVSEKEILDCIHSFVGEISQLTPMYSARKVNGKKLYEYAREGKIVERAVKKVRIYSISDVKIDLLKHTVSMRVVCEKGTYIRTLCNDIGEALGCGAAMTELTRTRVDVFTLENALKLSEVELLVQSGRADAALLNTDILFLKYRKLYYGKELEKYVINGNKLRTDNFKVDLSEEEIVRIYSMDERFTALYKKEGEFLKVVSMFL